MNEKSLAVKETREALVALNEVSIHLIKIFKDGFGLGNFIDLWKLLQNDEDLKTKIAAAYEGYAAIPEELEKLDLAGTLELTYVQLGYVPTIAAALREEAPAEEPVPEVPAEEPVPELPAEEPVPEVPAEEPVPEVPAEEPVPEVPAEEPAPEVPAEEPFPSQPEEGSSEDNGQPVEPSEPVPADSEAPVVEEPKEEELPGTTMGKSSSRRR